MLVRSRRTESAENKTKLSQHVVPFALFLSADSPGPELAGSGRWAVDAPEEEEVSWLLDRGCESDPPDHLLSFYTGRLSYVSQNWLHLERFFQRKVTLIDIRL